MNNIYELICKDNSEIKTLGIYHLITVYEQIKAIIDKGCDIKSSDGNYVYFDNYKEFNCIHKIFHKDYEIYKYVRKLIIKDEFRKKVEKSRSK